MEHYYEMVSQSIFISRVTLHFSDDHTYEMLCAIWYHLYNLKKMEKYPMSITFKLYKWYQIAQRITYY